jgi:predicted nucleotidyltransferase component of viral defense system
LWAKFDLPFYLTGGTALGRFYLNHRYSEDLDFFINSDPNYSQIIKQIKRIVEKEFYIEIQQSLFTEDFTRIYIVDNEVFLKVEFVNDVEYHSSKPLAYQFGYIDTVENILSNKLTAIVNRDEAKDVFDIVCIAMNFSFNWAEIFEHSKEKAVINELDVEHRINTFPVSWLENIHWIDTPIDLELIQSNLMVIANDFFLGKDNSLGKSKPHIGLALPKITRI